MADEGACGGEGGLITCSGRVIPSPFLVFSLDLVMLTKTTLGFFTLLFKAKGDSRFACE